MHFWRQLYSNHQPVSPAIIDWDDCGQPRSRLFDDIYFSDAGGLEESLHVFLDGNNLPNRWKGRGSFTIGEIGFGAGVNFLVTCKTWADYRAACPEAKNSKLHYVAFEKHPILPADLEKIHSLWDELLELGRRLREVNLPLDEGFYRACWDDLGVVLTLAIGDARELLPRLTEQVDSWYLDGFALVKNPELWEKGLFSEIVNKSAPGATLATYSVARDVRLALAAVGVDIQKRPGFGRKKQMLVGSVNR